MIALFTDVPRYCPGCGRPVRIQDAYTRQDFNAPCSFTCTGCGAVQYQKISVDLALEAADKAGGDLRQHYGR